MARPKSDVDPRDMEVRPRKRKRKHRSKPDPHPLNVAQKEQAVERLKAMPANPGVLFEPRVGGGWVITSPHSDVELWEAQMASAFGSNSTSVRKVFLRELKHLCRQDWDEDAGAWRVSEVELNAVLAMVNDVQPRNTAEAALAAQLVAVFLMQMRVSRQALNSGGMVIEKDAALAGKLARTYAILLQTLHDMRGEKKPVRQTIKVEKTLKQEVHYHDHRTGADEERDTQPREPTIEQPAEITDQREALRRDDTDGRVVPLSRAKGQG